MFQDEKHQSPYRGFLISLLVMIVPGLLFYLAVNGGAKAYRPAYSMRDQASSQALACMLSLLIHMIAMLSGLFSRGWRALKFRIKDFFECLSISVSYAFKAYWNSIKTDGVTFDIHLLFMLGNLHFLMDGIYRALPFLFE